MILSFAVESFTFSSLALLAYIVYAWLPKRRMNDYEQNIFFALIAGITLTNGAKFILAQWQKSKGLFAQFYSTIKASLLFISLCIIGLTIAIIRWYYVIFSVDPNINLIKHLIGDTTNYILQSSPMQALKEIGYNMGVSSILFSIGSLHEETFANTGTFDHRGFIYLGYSTILSIWSCLIFTVGKQKEFYYYSHHKIFDNRLLCPYNYGLWDKRRLDICWTLAFHFSYRPQPYYSKYKELHL